MNDEIFMKRALALAKEAFDDGEVPVGAVIVKDGSIISEGRNRREKSKNALSHAEIEAINKACEILKGWRLTGCTMYVTLEPCPMCAGAIINSRIERVIIGASDESFGAFGGSLDLRHMPGSYKPEIRFGTMNEESSKILKDFFTILRK